MNEWHELKKRRTNNLMKLLSVNVGHVEAIEGAGKTGTTGIFKQPVQGPVFVSTLGIPEDAVVDKKNHGGEDQAIYIYTSPDYAWWADELGREMSPGTFGENLTLSDLDSATVAVGDTFHIGEVVLQVTAARIPCKTLARRMDDPDFIQRFREAEKPGFYCRVLREGRLQAGQPVTLEPFQGERITMAEMLRDFYTHGTTEEAIGRYLRAPIASRARRDKERQLAQLEESTKNTNKHE
jgi:MOSC domain-containing protein YiiM